MAVACIKPQTKKGKSLIAVQSPGLYSIHIHCKGFKLCMTKNEKKMKMNNIEIFMFGFFNPEKRLVNLLE